ncbi:MAG: HEAT repeat domain-containing protein, partial [Pirellulaceae bacterium]
RNAAIVLGNQRHPSSCESLCLGLADSEPLVRGASAWALGQLASPLAVEILAERLPLEDDSQVTLEIEQALHASNGAGNSPGP